MSSSNICKGSNWASILNADMPTLAEMQALRVGQLLLGREQYLERAKSLRAHVYFGEELF